MYYKIINKYYQKHEERLRKEAGGRYKNLSEVKNDKIRKEARERKKNLSKVEKEKRQKKKRIEKDA